MFCAGLGMLYGDVNELSCFVWGWELKKMKKMKTLKKLK